MVGIRQGREGVGKGDVVGLTIEENEEDESEAMSVFKKQEQKRKDAIIPNWNKRMFDIVTLTHSIECSVLYLYKWRYIKIVIEELHYSKHEYN